jgi:hypothetical protein
LQWTTINGANTLQLQLKISPNTNVLFNEKPQPRKLAKRKRKPNLAKEIIPIVKNRTIGKFMYRYLEKKRDEKNYYV